MPALPSRTLGLLAKPVNTTARLGRAYFAEGAGLLVLSLRFAALPDCLVRPVASVPSGSAPKLLVSLGACVALNS